LRKACGRQRAGNDSKGLGPYYSPRTLLHIILKDHMLSWSELHSQYRPREYADSQHATTSKKHNTHVSDIRLLHVPPYHPHAMTKSVTYPTNQSYSRASTPYYTIANAPSPSPRKSTRPTRHPRTSPDPHTCESQSPRHPRHVPGCPNRATRREYFTRRPTTQQKNFFAGG
jgi:hypothetical protein